MGQRAGLFSSHISYFISHPLFFGLITRMVPTLVEVCVNTQIRPGNNDKNNKQKN